MLRHPVHRPRCRCKTVALRRLVRLLRQAGLLAQQQPVEPQRCLLAPSVLRRHHRFGFDPNICSECLLANRESAYRDLRQHCLEFEFSCSVQRLHPRRAAVSKRLEITNPDGSDATQLTSALQAGGTTRLSTSASATSVVAWNPGGAITLLNEYLWVEWEWNTVAVGAAGSDVMFYVVSAGAITTSDLHQALLVC